MYIRRFTNQPIYVYPDHPKCSKDTRVCNRMSDHSVPTTPTTAQADRWMRAFFHFFSGDPSLLCNKRTKKNPLCTAS